MQALRGKQRDARSRSRPLAAAALLAALAACSLLAPAAPRPSADAGPLDAQQAQHILSEQGYRDIRNMRQTANGWEADATRDGKALTVDVDNYGIIHMP